MPSNLAIIPARAGSKRIAGKNIRDFAGRPILAWSVDVALKSGLFAQVMVSTDDEAIAQIAREAGAQVPFLRSPKNADDHATIADVLKEVVSSLAESNQRFDNICCLFATAPFVIAEDLKAGLALLDHGSFEVVLPVARFASPIQRSLSRADDGGVAMTYPEHANTRTQDLDEAYHDAGQWVWVKTSYLESGHPLLGPSTGSIVIDNNRVADIDTEEDWQRAQWQFEWLRTRQTAA